MLKCVHFGAFRQSEDRSFSFYTGISLYHSMNCNIDCDIGDYIEPSKLHLATSQRRSLHRYRTCWCFWCNIHWLHIGLGVMRFNGRIVIPRESIKKKATGAAAAAAADADDAANEKSIIDLYVREVLMRDVTPWTRWDSLDKRCLCVLSATHPSVSAADHSSLLHLHNN